MNPALRVMVEAMAAELFRQSREKGTANVTIRPRRPGNPTEKTFLSGHFDLERVALAALAVAEPMWLAEYEAEAAETARMDAAVDAEWEGVGVEPEA